MPFHCPICIDTISDSNSNPAAALGCGHVFHANCILQWMESTSETRSCPNCKVFINKRKMISRLYFSAQPESVGNDPTIDNSEAIALQEEAVALREELVAVKQQNNHKLQASESRIRSLESQIADALLSKRYLKQIQSIAELDDDVSSLRSQKYLKELEKISHSELKVQAAALRARQLKAANERDDVQKRLEKTQRQNDILHQKNLHLFNKLERLQSKVKASATQPPQTETRNEQENIIVLDTDSDDEQNINTNSSGPSYTSHLIDLDDNSDDEVEFVIENYDPIVLGTLKRRNMANNNKFDGLKRSRV